MLAREREQFQTKNQELERSLEAHETSAGRPARPVRETSTNWEAERLALELRYEKEHREFVHETEQQLEEQRVRAAADWQLLKEQMEAAQTQFNHQRGNLESELARLRKDVETLRQERDRLASDRASERQRLERALAEEMARAAATKQELQEELGAVRRQLDRERASLRTELEQAQAEAASGLVHQDQLRRQVELLAKEREQLAADRAEIDTVRQHAEAQAQAEIGQFGQALERAQRREEALARRSLDLAEQHQSLRAEFDQLRSQDNDRQRRFAESERKLEVVRGAAMIEQEKLKFALAEEQTRFAADRQKWHTELETAQKQFDENRSSLRQELERLRQEADALRQERDYLTAHRSQMDARIHEKEENTRTEIAGLTRQVEASQQLLEAAARDNQRLTEQIHGLRAERDAEATPQTSLAALQQELEATRANGRAERDRIMRTLAEQQALAAGERNKWQEELDTVRRQCDQDRAALQSEIESVRQHAAGLQQERDAALQQIHSLTQEWSRLAAQREQLESSRQEKERRTHDEVPRLDQAVEQGPQKEEATARHNEELTELARTPRPEIAPEQSQVQKELEVVRADRERLEQALAEEQKRNETDRKTWQEEMEEVRRQFNQDRAALEAAAVWARQEATHFRNVLRSMGVTGL